MKTKLEKMEGDDKRQRERLFSLKSACSEANEAYEIVKKQNYVMKRETEEVKKRLSEKDSALETSEKEKRKNGGADFKRSFFKFAFSTEKSSNAWSRLVTSSLNALSFSLRTSLVCLRSLSVFDNDA